MVALQTKAAATARKNGAAKKHRAPPSHPPYIQMVKEALAALKERTGSSHYAIAKHMEEKQKVTLPLNFKKLLSVQLKKLVAGGKLVKVKNSFKLPPLVARKKPVVVKKPPAAADSKPKGLASKKKLRVDPKPNPVATGAPSKTAKAAVKPKKAVKVTKGVKKPRTIKSKIGAKKVVKVAKSVKKPTSVKSKTDAKKVVKVAKVVKSPVQKVAAGRTKKLKAIKSPAKRKASVVVKEPAAKKAKK